MLNKLAMLFNSATRKACRGPVLQTSRYSFDPAASILDLSESRRASKVGGSEKDSSRFLAP